jgi:hypothetical protein
MDFEWLAGIVYNRESILPLSFRTNSVLSTAESDIPRMVFVGESLLSVSLIAGTKDDTECLLFHFESPNMNRNENLHGHGH